MGFLKWFIKKSAAQLALLAIALIDVLTISKLATAKACCVVLLGGVLLFYGFIQYDRYLEDNKK